MLYILIFLHQTATGDILCYYKGSLYILIFLHQTATHQCFGYAQGRCISLYSYIKPQRTYVDFTEADSCISLYSYIKPQHIINFFRRLQAVYPYIPTSNRNLISGNSFVQRGIHYIQEIKNGSVGPYFIAKLLKKFQLYRLSNKFSFLTTFCAFRLSTEIINITILLISN
mgnify:CR=1 FL=1